MDTLAGTDLVGAVVIYRGSLTASFNTRCVVVAYDEWRGTYTLDPIICVGPARRRMSQVHRMSFLCDGGSFPVCQCGHAVTHRLPEPVCGRCECPDHHGRPIPTEPVPDTGGLTDIELWERVRTGDEQVVRDDAGHPVAVVIPYGRYVTDRAAAQFHGV